MEILSCENVAFKYNESTDYAISDCTFSVKKGEKIMLCGASGSGKSTLLRLLKRVRVSPRGESFVGTSPLWARTEASFLIEKVPKSRLCNAKP